MKIQTNTAANSALGYMKTNAEATERSIQKLSSGFRINRAADDAAGLAIANQLRADSKTLGQAQKNAQQAGAMLQIADGATSTLGNIFNRMRELASQGASANIGGQGSKLQDEWTSLNTEADRIIKGTSYQGTNVLTGLTAKLAQSATAGTAALAAGATSAQSGSVTSIAASVTSTNAQNAQYTLSVSGSNMVATRSTDGATDTVSVTPASGKLSFATFGLDITTAVGYSSGAAVNGVAAAFTTASDSTITGATGITAGTTSTPTNLANGTYAVKDGAAGVLELWSTGGSAAKISQTSGAVAGNASSAAFANGVSINLSGFTAAVASAPAVAGTAGTFQAGSGFSAATGFANTVTNGTYHFADEAGNTGKIEIRDSANALVATSTAAVTAGATSVAFSNGITVTGGGSFTAYTASTPGSAGTVAGTSATATTYASVNVSGSASRDGAYTLRSSGGASGNITLELGGSQVGSSVAKSALVGGSTVDFGNGITLTLGASFDKTAETLEAETFSIGGSAAATSAVASSAATKTFVISGQSNTINSAVSSANNDTFTVAGGVTPVAAGTNTLDGAKINVTGALKAQTASNVPTILVGTSASQGTGTYAANDSIGLDLGSLQNNAILNLSTKGNFEAGGNVVGVDLTTIAGSQDALTRLDSALSSLNTFVGKLGAAESRVDYATQNVDSMLQNTTAAESSIRDADMATEMSAFTKNNILQQAAQSMLSQANQGTQGILQLLRG